MPPEEDAVSPTQPLHLLLDNVRSIFNVGSVFRTADGAGTSHLYLGGITPGPEHKAMRKTALGAEELIQSSKHADSVQLAEELSETGHVLWALERTRGSVDVFEAASERPSGSLVLILGNEVAGVDPGILQFWPGRPGSLPPRGSHRFRTCGTTAYGSSDQEFAT
ncbi:MAG: RNA methyltransferase [Myxococcales bacterium]|nr:RNA methyltransferase [Myxococcales bacterium]